MEQLVGGPGGPAAGTIEPRHGMKGAKRQTGLRGIEPPEQSDQQDNQTEYCCVAQANPPDGMSIRIHGVNGGRVAHEPTFSFGMPL